MASSPAILRVEAGRTVLDRSDNGGSSGFVALERSMVTRPFLKWTGGKQWLAAVAPALIGADVSARYFEPFVGGGSVFFALGVTRATLGDACEELIDAYRGVRDSPEKVIAALRTYPHDRAFFERIRRVDPRTPHTKAARLIYLNKTAFNGMYRVNLKGEFNVPFGRYVNPTICDSDRIRAAGQALAGVRLRAGDFEATTKTAPGWGRCVSRSALHHRAPQQRVLEVQRATLLLGGPAASCSDGGEAQKARCDRDREQ